MKDILKYVLIFMFGVVVFVKAGEKGGVSGGYQASQILNSAGSAISGTIGSLYGG